MRNYTFFEIILYIFLLDPIFFEKNITYFFVAFDKIRNKNNKIFQKSLFLSELLLLHFMLCVIICFFVLLERQYIGLIIDISRTVYVNSLVT